MHRRTLLQRLSLLALVGTASRPSLSETHGRISVLASFSILGDLVRVVGATRVKVMTLVGPDGDAHEFEPRPADIRTLLNSQLFVINGLNFEPWADKLVKSAGYKSRVVTASEGIRPQRMAGAATLPDPHAWQNPLHVVQYVHTIANALSQSDPAGAATYHTNALAYEQELKAFDAEASAQMAALAPAQRKVITSHDAFGYLGAHYGITLLAPEGVNPESEPSARHLGQLIRQIRRNHIKAVFVENMRNPRLLAQLAKDVGITLGPTLYADALSGPNGPAPTYLALMRHNLAALIAGMRLN